ncbi:MAG: glycosyltransferase family 9 protein [Sulfurovum sp.]
MKTPLHSILRKKLRSALHFIISKLSKKSLDEIVEDKIDIDEIKTIIIIRPNYRIGNIIFLTPLLNELEKILPNAKIDIIVGMKLAGDILEEMPNVGKVIDIPRKLLLHPIDLYRFIKSSRAKKYDLAINITAGSVSSEIVISLINSQYSVSFQSENSFITPSYIVQYEGLYRHAGSQALEFLKLFGTTLPKDDIELDIKLTDEEREIAQKDFDKLIEDNKVSKENITIALFRNARFDKKISDNWWNEWHKELLNLDSAITIIDILSPDIESRLNENCLEYSNKNLRVLGAFFASCDTYISADTGPLHLSSASGAKTIGLFNQTEIEVFGTLGEHNKNIEINNLTPKYIAKLCYAQLSEPEDIDESEEEIEEEF